ncbi:MAG: AEC family transporter [Eubacteriales bacterium]|nr:AEC family transporter [Eubacteriales bacterium]
MSGDFITVINQVMILTAIIGCGFLGKRTGLVKNEAFETLTNITLYFAVPCLLIRAFQIDFTPDSLIGFFLQLGIAAVYHAIAGITGLLVFRRAPEQKKRVYICCLVNGNIGFMGYAMILTLFGNAGMFYASAYNLVFNIVFWSVCIGYLNQESEKATFRSILLNPNIASALIGFMIFILQIRLPDVVDRGMGYLASLSMPIPLIVIGARLTELKPRLLAGDKYFWMCALLRLLVLPLLFGGALRILGVSGLLLQVTVILSGMPTASMLGMLAGKNDPEIGSYTAGVISGITALSMITIPVTAAFAALMA